MELLFQVQTFQNEIEATNRKLQEMNSKKRTREDVTTNDDVQLMIQTAVLPLANILQDMNQQLQQLANNQFTPQIPQTQPTQAIARNDNVVTTKPEENTSSLEIQEVTKFKDLGVIYDHHLSFEEHRKEVFKHGYMLINYGYRLG